MTNAAAPIARFLARYGPATAKFGKALRAKLRARLPGLLELVYVYERQGSLVIAYSPTEVGADAVCALAIDPSQVRLCLTGGDRLAKSDPEQLLQGRGKLVRHIALGSMADFARPEIEALIAAAVRIAGLSLDPRATGGVVLKVEAQRQRARRARRATKPSPAGRKARTRR